jgi:hypothetical protein
MNPRELVHEWILPISQRREDKTSWGTKNPFLLYWKSKKPYSSIPLLLMSTKGSNSTILNWPENSFAGRRWLRRRRSFEKFVQHVVNRIYTYVLTYILRWLYRWSLSILRNRYAVLSLFFYIFFLHLLVVFTLYRTSHQLGDALPRE